MSNSIVVALGADERYSVPLAVAVRSLLDNAFDPRRLEIWILDGGLSPRTVERLWRSWEPTQARLSIVSADLDRLEGLPRMGSRLSSATYLRLFMPEMLTERDRGIYLDADTLVLSDLGELWKVELQEQPIAAVQEAYVPYVSSDNGLMNWRDLGLEPDAKYFNPGVMILDLARWREENITLKVIRYLTSQTEFVRWHDQDALNAVLAGRWRELDRVWNVTPYWDRPEHRLGSNVDILQRVRILHFLSDAKPWLPGYEHRGHLKLFQAYLRRTDWAGEASGRDYTLVRKALCRIGFHLG
jgi:lipopolysaccharide biosynthesis glycosyltransferase